MISAVVLTRDEEENIARCLRSLSFCDEIIVVDNLSSDNTVEIAKEHKAKIFTRELKDNFAEQRNFGLEKATGKWILFIDADEEVSPELMKEVRRLEEGVDAFYLRRRDFWWGKELKYGETSGVRHYGMIRLVKRNSGSWDNPVHEVFKTSGTTARLSSFINHYPHPTIKEFLRKINYYSTLRAKELLKQKQKVGTFQVFAYPFGKFLSTYFLQLGFLDGAAGFAYSFFMSFHSFLVRAKLYQYHHFHDNS
ncbi:MAG: glycosyltransferase family 2 protein [Patescibacteria group bacterium]